MWVLLHDIGDGKPILVNLGTMLYARPVSQDHYSGSEVCWGDHALWVSESLADIRERLDEQRVVKH